MSDELSTDYDIVAVTETVTYNDGASGSVTYCPPMQGMHAFEIVRLQLFILGQPTTPASP